MDSKIALVVPAFNEKRTIAAVIRDLKMLSGVLVIVVDDGSSDESGEIAKREGALVLRHPVNRGLGAALQTGFKKALTLGVDFIVTFDADGQHRASDIGRMIQPLRAGEADAVIGSRNFSKNVPVVRKIYNLVANFLGFLFFGIYVSDTQSGLRAFRRDTLLKFRPLGDRMEVSSEIIGELKRIGARIKEIPIESIYTSYSLSKGQSFMTGIKTLFAIILHKLGR